MKVYIVSDWLRQVDGQQPRAKWSLNLIEKFMGDIDIQKLSNGKPVIVNKPLYINWTHNNRYLIIAISELGHVGVDVEFSNLPYNEALYGWVLHSQEKEKFTQGVSFSELWTRKEAYVKCTGVGIYDEMCDFNSYDLKDVHVTSFFWQEVTISVCSAHDEEIELCSKSF